MVSSGQEITVQALEDDELKRPFVESLLRYIDVIIIKSNPRALCFEEKSIVVPQVGMFTLKDVFSRVTGRDEFKGNQQQDACEALDCLLSNVPSYSFCCYEYQWNFECSRCHLQRTTATEIGNVLRVPVPHHETSQVFCLKNAILKTLTGEEDFEVNCPRRERHGCESTNAKRGMSILTAPTFLVVQALLFAFQGGIQQKLPHQCIPVQEIDIQVGGQIHRYKLLCIIEHVGPTMDVGHYKSYFQRSGTWFQVDDSNHNIVGIDGLPKQPYISVYFKEASI